jgi:ribosome biogenesis protein Nip4
MRTTARAGRALVAVFAVALALTGAGRAADDKPKDGKKDEKKLTVMQRKLLHSQGVLEGLATNNFEKIGNGADGLIECVQHATWKINETEKYVLYSNDFLRRAEGLKKAAKEKNVDAAALAYVDMTLTCVKCHQYLREPAVR